MRITALLLAAAVALTSGAQVRNNVTVEVVQVPVYVTASDGQPVRGLTKDSFTLLVDGHPQTIDYFYVIDFAAERQTLNIH